MKMNPARESLLDSVWGVDFDGQPNILDVYIKNLRTKIDSSSQPAKVNPHRSGVGYMLSENVQER